MRIFADLNRLPDVGPEPTSVIVQVSPTAPVGAPSVPSNGKFYVEVPEGVFPPPITLGSRLLGPSNLVDAIFNGLLKSFPTYRFIRYNALLTSIDVAALDLTATFPVSPGPPPVKYKTRAQVGRGGFVNQGLAPNSVSIFPDNTTTTPSRPGCLITNTIDISADVPAGSSNFLVYWKIHEYSVSPDVMAYDGPGAGLNDASLKGLVEVDQSPTDLEVYLSANDGGGYSRVGLLMPINVCDPGTKLRLAFINKSTAAKRYLASYAVLYK